MPSPLKNFVSGEVIFITSTVEEGILLPANPLMHLIVLACIARAYTLHPILLHDLIVEGSHIHLLITVVDPDDVIGFMRSFKTESAHAINHLLGRKKRTVWCDGYDNPVQLTAFDAMQKLIYLYGNPAKDGLVDDIAHYPGVCSWNSFLSGTPTEVTAPKLRRPDIKELPKGSLTLRYYEEQAEELRKKVKAQQSFTLTPLNWQRAFGLSEEAATTMRERVLHGVHLMQEHYVQERKDTYKQCKGRAKLLREGFRLDYVPARKGKKMWCHCHQPELRKAYIKRWKAAREEGRWVQSCWKMGDLSVPYPPGLYPPSMPKLCNVLPPPAGRPRSWAG